jgi:cyclophilin family peptidyl-prolyl cis-trans isomerase
MGKTLVKLETSKGEIELELFEESSPLTVENFLDYVKGGFFDGTIFHRVIPNFMIQGGGMLPGLDQKKTHAPIKNEAGNGKRNFRGTVAMARTNVVDSATSQFFINLKDNAFLDHQDESPRGFGYCVFGKVVSGMNVVDEIASVQTGSRGMHDDVPKTDVAILKASVI